MKDIKKDVDKNYDIKTLVVFWQSHPINMDTEGVIERVCIKKEPVLSELNLAKT